MRILLVVNGLVSIIGAMCTALYDRWVFSAAGLVSFAGWNILVPVCFAIVALSRDGAVAGDADFLH